MAGWLVVPHCPWGYYTASEGTTLHPWGYYTAPGVPHCQQGKKTCFSSHVRCRETVSLPAGQLAATAVVKPLPVFPSRLPLTLLGSPDALPHDLLLIDVESALAGAHLAGNLLYCSAALSSRSGDLPSRTRAVRVSSDGSVAWKERLVLKLPPRAGAHPSSGCRQLMPACLHAARACCMRRPGSLQGLPVDSCHRPSCSRARDPGVFYLGCKRATWQVAQAGEGGVSSGRQVPGGKGGASPEHAGRGRSCPGECAAGLAGSSGPAEHTLQPHGKACAMAATAAPRACCVHGQGLATRWTYNLCWCRRWRWRRATCCSTSTIPRPPLCRWTTGHRTSPRSARGRCP
jgi:hypothetical protein